MRFRDLLVYDSYQNHPKSSILHEQGKWIVLPSIAANIAPNGNPLLIQPRSIDSIDGRFNRTIFVFQLIWHQIGSSER